MEHPRPVGLVLLLPPGELRGYQESPVLVPKPVYAITSVIVNM